MYLLLTLLLVVVVVFGDFVLHLSFIQLFERNELFLMLHEITVINNLVYDGFTPIMRPTRLMPSATSDFC